MSSLAQAVIHHHCDSASHLHRRIALSSPKGIAMSAPEVPTSPPSEGGDPRTIVYDPNDPFWRDTDDDDDDMDYLPAATGSEEDEDGEVDLSFHGAYEISNIDQV
jgi:hypothetical protein